MITNSRNLVRVSARTGGYFMVRRISKRMLVLFAGVACALAAFAQQGRPAQPPSAKQPNMKPGPAPRHDISGTWEPANGPGDGIQAGGVKAMPNDGKPEHELPYTPYGLEIYKSHKALEGKDAVAPAFYND